MRNRKKVWGLGMMLVGAAVACTPEFRELGDEPVAGGGSGGGSNDKAGSGSVSPKGGSKSSPPGAAGDGPSSAGAPAAPDECFSPTDHLELAREPNAGCECEGDELACVEGSVPFPGAALLCVDGHWTLTSVTCDRGCFAPTETPALALEPGSVGCPCDDDPPECVRTMYEGRPWDIAMYCVDGRWTQAEDGVCDSFAPGCKVDDVSYPSGARRVPTPFSACNTCDCQSGELVNCTTRECADTLCDEGSSQARRCLCGPAGGCSEYEIGCLSGDGCEEGLCSAACI